MAEIRSQYMMNIRLLYIICLGFTTITAATGSEILYGHYTLLYDRFGQYKHSGHDNTKAK